MINSPKRLSKINFLLWIFGIAALFWTTCMIVPVMPVMPLNGLDYSWAYALDEAVARHLVFGRDIIFTYGPLAAIETRMYHPATDGIMVVGSMLVATGLCAGFTVLAGKNPLLILILPIVFAEAVSIDAILMSLPLLLLLVVAKSILRPDAFNKSKTSKFEVPCIILLSCAVAILPLIKGSFAVIALVEGGLAIVILSIQRRIFLAVSIAIVASLTLILTWVGVGQPLFALPQFFLTQQPVIGGYSEAMSNDGPYSAVLYWAITALLILSLFYWQLVRRKNWIGWIALLGLLFYLFITFKAGFVRQDAHSRISGAAFLIIMIYLLALLDIKSSLGIVAIALFGWIAIEQSVAPFDAQIAYTRLKWQILSISQGLDVRLSGENYLSDSFDRALASIRAENPLPPITGTADIYPFNLMPLFASRINWAGRPIPQSYAAYTPALNTENATHLSSSTAPDNIFFSIVPIDDRLPALEDSESWPIILTHYVPIVAWEEYIQMKRVRKPTEAHFHDLATISGSVNEKLDLPELYHNIWVSIDMTPTLLGRIVLGLFRLPLVYVELTLEDGSVVRHRYIPEMGKAGFLLSPYISSWSEFLRIGLSTTKSHYVTSFKLITPDEGLWRKNVSISYSALNIEPQLTTRQFLVTHQSPEPEAITSSESSNAECSIDFVDDKLLGSHPTPFEIDTDIVPIKGWAAPSVTDGIAPEETWVSLSGDNGDRHFYKSQIQPRKDVITYFHHPEMGDIGFNANLDLSGLTGRKKVTVYLLKDRKVYSCPIHPVLFLVTHQSPEPEAITSAVENINAECSIDFIDDKLLGNHPDPFEISSDIVPIKGWAAPSVTQGIAADETWVSLRGDNGDWHFYKSEIQPRKDVTTYFHHSDMRDVGFNLNLDLSGLKGRQKVTIYSLKDGKVYTCPTQPILLLQ